MSGLKAFLKPARVPFCLLIRSGGLKEVKEHESFSVNLCAASAAAFKETWTGLSVSLYSAVLQVVHHEGHRGKSDS